MNDILGSRNSSVSTDDLSRRIRRSLPVIPKTKEVAAGETANENKKQVYYVCFKLFFISIAKVKI